MSDRTDQIIEHHLNQRPGARHAHQHDQFFHTQVETLRSLLGVMESEMQRENIPYDSAGRVLDGVMGVCLSDWEREKLRRERERELLLTTFEPSASDVTINQPFTDPGPVSVKDDPEQTAAWIDKMQKEAAEYWRGTEPPERPTASKEPTP
jgi:hypothetical protein